MAPRRLGSTPEAHALIIRHGPVFDHFAHRWCLKADLPDGTRATTIFDLAPNLHRAHIHPAAIPTYSMVLTPTDTDRLIVACHAGARPATITNPGRTLTVTHSRDSITMTSTTRDQQLTLTYRNHAAEALAILAGELHLMLTSWRRQAS
ncbi:hypothetical protein [Actinokineospora diospyrosa]|uniref:Uncharacterized protein n=1 Tax=Actinokineospora diospyrosa TaxID=103728 RepID=A0ABT1IE17_9PSEU|nr:hypothetical protein [Actinokineospora diospyrosa]MCP2270863.1 hypothetical protein [Actinokineospora diospyrosa]